MHEIEICDFVIECGENRIAAKKENFKIYRANIGLYMVNGFLVIYFMYTPLFVKLYIIDTSYMAGGHRCSLRHNVWYDTHKVDSLIN